MRNKFFVTLMASLFSCSAAFAFWAEAADSSFDIGGGYRNDRFKWETRADFTSASEATNQEVLKSKLNWRNLNIWQIEARGKYVTCDNLYIRGMFDYGWITKGKVRDSDFVITRGSSSDSSSSDSDLVSSGSEEEFIRSRSGGKRGHVYDANIAVGYQFQLCDDSLALSPVIGYSWNGQHLEIKNGHNCIPVSTSIENLHSKYHARWNGPFLGIDADYRFSCDWSLFATYEFHWAHYHAKAHWNLRTDLVDGRFHHSARNGYGNLVNLGIKWDFCECWTASLIGQWQGWFARHGKDRATLIELELGDVELTTVVSTPLRHVEWQSGSISLDVGMVF